MQVSNTFILGNSTSPRAMGLRIIDEVREDFADMNNILPLIDAGAALNVRDGFGATSLIWAAWQGHDHAAFALLTSNAPVDAQNYEGRTALISAAMMGNDDIARNILLRGAKKDLQDDRGQTALIAAVLWMHESTARLLLAEGAKADIRDNSGKSALDYAGGRMSPEFIEALTSAIALEPRNSNTPVFKTSFHL